MRQRGKLASVGLLTSSSILLTGLGVITSALTARVLGVESRGEFVTILLWNQLLTWISTAGLGRSQVYLTNTTLRDPTALSRLMSGLFLYAIAAGATLGFAGSHLMARLCQVHSPAILTVTVPISLLSDLTNNQLIARLQYKAYSYKRVFEAAAWILLLAAAAIFSALTLDLALCAFIASLAGGCVYAASAWSREGIPLFVAPDGRILKSAFRYGIRAHSADMPRTALNYLPQLVVTPVLGVAACAIYAAAQAVAGLISLVSVPLATVAFGDISGCETDTRGPRIRAYAAGAVVTSLIGYVCIVVLSQWAIPAIYGVAFLASVPVARLLACWGAISAVGGVFQSCLYGCGAPLKVARASITGAVATAACLTMLLPRRGLEGTALSAIFGSAIECTLLAVQIPWRVKQYQKEA